jgi:methylglutaconyl-CoA hydratase
MAEDAGLTVATRDGVVEVVIDRGDDRNLLTLDMCHQLVALLTAPPADAHIVRLRAVGPAFCLGRERAADAVDDLRAEATTLVGVNEALRSSPLVTVAEVAGGAAGFGAGLVANADVAVAADTAEFWFPEVRIDLAPAVVLSWLPRIVGRKQAFWLTASGERLSAERAQALGLVTAVVPADRLEGEVDELVTRLRSFQPRVHRAIKDYLNATEDLPRSAAAGLATEKLILGSLSRRREGEHAHPANES